MFGLTDTVTLRSTVGPLHLRVRVMDPNTGYRVDHYDWGFDNGFRCDVSRRWWEEVQDQYLDRADDLTYHKALRPV